MTKQDKIQEAYGEYYDNMKPWIDENGWFNKNAFYEKNFVFKYDDLKLFFTHKGDFMIPRNIFRLTNNNGWVKIESEYNLPKEGNFFALRKETNEIVLATSFNISKNYHSHYMEIRKPDLPLY